MRLRRRALKRRAKEEKQGGRVKRSPFLPLSTQGLAEEGKTEVPINLWKGTHRKLGPLKKTIAEERISHTFLKDRAQREEIFQIRESYKWSMISRSCGMIGIPLIGRFPREDYIHSFIYFPSLNPTPMVWRGYAKPYSEPQCSPKWLWLPRAKSLKV